MDTNNKEVEYRIWEGPLLKADVYVDVKLPTGGIMYGANIGQLEIKHGDALYLDHGRSMGVHTMSGKGFEAEYQYGKVTLHGCPVVVVLQNSEQNRNAKYVHSSKKDFESLVVKQKERVAPQIEKLKEKFIFDELARRSEKKAREEESKKQNQDKIQEAVGKMESFFGRNKRYKH